jgi:hypothetical protein
MGIRISAIGRVVNHTIEKFVEITSETWKGFTQNARLYSSSGEDSVPCKDDQILLIKIDGTGRYAAIGTLTPSRKAKPGEKLFFARDIDSEIVSMISMLNDGSIKAVSDGDFSVETKKGFSVSGKEDITIKSDENITSKATKKNVVKGADVEIEGNTKLTGGSVECKGTASPTGTGCWCAKPFCTWDGTPHTGDKVDGA